MPIRPTRRCEGRLRLAAAGFSLIEVLIALALLMVSVLGLAQLFTYSAAAVRQGRTLTTVAVLASEKLDQLRTLAFTYDAAGVRLTDTTSDATSVPEAPTGGQGLAPSGLSTLDVDTPGYCDFLDASGRVLGRAPTRPGDTAFVRRWAVVPLATDPQDSVLIHVRVLSRVAADQNVQDADGVTFSTLRTRSTW